jgi:chemotaxis protein MotB
MRRRKAPKHQENHERWLVSYADFVTLLFAFFVVMYATSQANQAKAVQFAQSMRMALDDDKVSRAIGRLLGRNTPAPKEIAAPIEEPPAQSAHLTELAPSYARLNDALRDQISNGRMDVRMERRGLVISLREKAFFPSGGDAIDAAMNSTLNTIASAIVTLPHPIRFEGHTDAVPIHTPRFRSNWELSAARGIAMLEVFASLGVPRDRMAIAGFAEVAPLASNDTPEGRSQNRRVDIVLLNEFGRQGEPATAGGVTPAAPPPGR